MSRKPLIAALVLLLSACQALAADPSSAPASQPAKPVKDNNYRGVFKFNAVKQGVVGGKPVMSVQVAKIEGGNAVEMFVPANDSAGAIDTEAIKSAGVGDLLEIVCTKTNSPALVGLKKYDINWGEDEPGVFVFSKKDETTSGKDPAVTITVTKFLQPFVLKVPGKRASDGKLVLDPVMMKTIDAVKAGQLVEVQADSVSGQYVLKHIEVFEPYRSVEFVRVVKDKVGKDELAGIEVKEAGTDGKTNAVRYYLDPADDDFAANAKKITTYGLGSSVLIQTASGDKGNWLLGIRTASLTPDSDPSKTVPTYGRPVRIRPIRIR